MTTSLRLGVAFALIAATTLAAQTPDLRELDVLASHSALVDGVTPFHRYISSGSTLAPRERELLILRIAALSASPAVWKAHVPVALQAGLTRADVARIATGLAASGWSAFDAALLRAAAELYAASFVSDATWAALASRYDRPQLIDAVFTVAHY